MLLPLSERKKKKGLSVCGAIKPCLLVHSQPTSKLNNVKRDVIIKHISQLKIYRPKHVSFPQMDDCINTVSLY